MTPPLMIERRFSGRAFTVLAGSAFAWSLLVLVAYFRRPLRFSSLLEMFSLPPGLAPASGTWAAVQVESLGVLLLAGVILFSLVGWGGHLARLAGSPGDGFLFSLPVRFGLGAAIANAWWIGTGFCGLWQRSFLTMAGILFLGAGVYSWIRQDFNRFPVKMGEMMDRWRTLSFPAKALGVVSACILAITLAHGLVPETFYDSMVYHLAVPSYWMSSRGIVDHPLNFFANYPYGGEMVLFNGFLWDPLFGSQAAKTLNGAVLILAVLAARDWVVSATGDREAGLLSGALLVTTPLLVMNAWSAQLEGMVCLFLLLFLRSFFTAVDSRDAGLALVSGFFAGMALSVKYTSILGIGAGVLAAGFILRWSGVIRAALPAGLAGLPAVLPWVLKNAVFTGNPFYPYLAGLFSGRQLPSWGYARLIAEQREMHAAALGDWLKLPWTLVMGEPVGPILLAAVPLFLVYRIRIGATRPLGAMLAVFFVAALAVTHHMRFLLAGFAAGYVFIAILSAATPAWVRRTLVGAALLVAVLGAPTLAQVSRHFYSCAGIWRGVETRTLYLKRAGVAPYFELPEWVNRNLPPGSVLLVAGDARGLYYRHRTLTNSVFDDPVLTAALREGLAAPEILRRLGRMGFTHLLVNAEEGLRSAADYRHYELSADEWSRLDDFVTRCLEPIAYLRDAQAVYRLLPEPAEGKVRPRSAARFIMMSRLGTDFVKALSRGDAGAAERFADEGLASCPALSFWWEQKAYLSALAGRNEEALRCFGEAESRGVLERESYSRWAGILDAAGMKARASAVRKVARGWYPNPG